MSEMMAMEDTTDICPVCGREYARIVGPPNVERVGDGGRSLEETLLPWLCVWTVGEQAYIVEHDR